MTRHNDELARHVRRLGNHELNELLLELSQRSFAALVGAALARPVLPAGLGLRFEPAPGVDRWTVVACAPRRQLGTLTRGRDPAGRVVYRAWTRAGDPVQLAETWWWRRRGDAAAALAWVTPVSEARCLTLAAYVRALPDRRLHALLGGLSRDRFDRLVDAAYRPYGLQVVEVNRPDRSTRRRQGKSDPIDAQAAARATLAGWPPPPQDPRGPGRDDPGATGRPPRRPQSQGGRRRTTPRRALQRP